MTFIDPETVHTPTPGGVPGAAWGDIIRDDLMFLASPPVFDGHNIGGLTSVPNSTTTAIAITSERYDNAGAHSTVTNTSRISPQIAGIYRFTATVRSPRAGSGLYRYMWVVNGAAASWPADAGAQIPLHEDTLNDMAGPIGDRMFEMNGSTDYVELVCYQTTGSTRTPTVVAISATWEGVD